MNSAGTNEIHEEGYMKISIRTLLASVLVFAVLFGVTAQDKGTIAPDQIPGTAVYVPYPVNITLDGSISDWKGVPVQRVTTGPSISPDKGQNQWVDFAVASDGKQLFVYMESQDTKIIAGKHGANFWNEDSMEFYVNLSKNLLAKSYGKDIAQVNINATNIGKTANDKLSLSGTNASSAKVRAHVLKTKNGWAYEAAMDLPKNFTVEHGKNIGFQVHANGATELDRDSKLIWGSLDTDDHSYQDPSLFGRAIFFKVGSTDVPEPQNMGLTLADIFKREGARGKSAKKLVWSDDFDTAGAPDPAKWDYDAWDVGKYNEELQIYTDSRDNSFVKDGKLTIRAILDSKGKWSSARLLTRGKQSWKYGYIEVKAKLPAGRGTWPAIWMMPERNSYGDWPASGEIDIMEHVGFDQDKIHTSVHTQDYNHRKGTQKTRSAKIPGVSDSFHTYAIEWNDKAIFWYVDDEPFYFFQREDGGYGVWPFDHPFHIILNVAMGGTWGGMKGMDPAVKQADMVVDYVKVYQ
jgi:hypothetical protein